MAVGQNLTVIKLMKGFFSATVIQIVCVCVCVRDCACFQRLVFWRRFANRTRWLVPDDVLPTDIRLSGWNSIVQPVPCRMFNK